MKSFDLLLGLFVIFAAILNLISAQGFDGLLGMNMGGGGYENRRYGNEGYRRDREMGIMNGMGQGMGRGMGRGVRNW